MVRVKLPFLILVFILIVQLGFLGGIYVMKLLLPTGDFFPVAPAKIFEARPPTFLPTLREITGGAQSDAEAYDRIVDYYVAHHQQIADALEETNETRLKALFVMNVVHISHIYEAVTDPGSFLAYLEQQGSQCGPYSHYESEIMDRFGLNWRIQLLSQGYHAWVEVNVDGQWEIFDATINAWISRSGAELMQGAERSYRYFYTPMLDQNRQDVVNWVLDRAQRLRLLMPALGLYFRPPLIVIEDGGSSSQNALRDESDVLAVIPVARTQA
jgi:hypothetical protein